MRFIWTIIVDPSQPFVTAHGFAADDPSNVRNGYGPTVADALEDAMGHSVQRWHETMGGKPWHERTETERARERNYHPESGTCPPEGCAHR